MIASCRAAALSLQSARQWMRLAVAAFAALAASWNLAAQSARSAAFPDDPGSSAMQAPPAQGSASLSGTLVDPNGAVIAGAHIRLSTGAETVSGSNGEFAFTSLAAGSVTLSVTAAGMKPYTSSAIALAEGEAHSLGPVVLAIAGASSEVRVYATPSAIAEQEVHEEVQQRVLGVLPNFYSNYDWNAAPLFPKQKFELAFHSVADPVSFVGVGVAAGIEQANNNFRGYGQGAQGYAKRYGAAYADDAIARLLSSAVLPSLFHQDPRYYYMGSGTVRTRALYAISRAVVTRGDNGRWQPNYSKVLGGFAAGGISNLYYPASDRGLSLTLEGGLLEIGGNAIDNLVREFVMKRLTSRVPSYHNGKPPAN